MKDHLNILFLSSRMPAHSANLGADIITSLTRAGHHVQFGFDGIEDYINKCTAKKKSSFLRSVYIKFHYYIRKYLNNLVDYLPKLPMWWYDGIVFFNTHEKCPPLSEKIVVNNLKGNYDICIVLFMHNMFTTKTLKAVYDKYHIPIIIYSVDMMPMTGGCYYFGECRNFENECGFCPVCGGTNKNDQSHKNYLYKKNVYDSIECVLFANTWMLNFARKSHLFDKSEMRCVSFNLDENVFMPLDILKCREKFGIPSNKRWVFLSRYRTIARKGMDVLVDGLNQLYDRLPIDCRKDAILILIGEKSDNINSIFKMDVLQLGFLSINELIEAYNASTVFLCTSTEDAGPSMVNQSMACGTPVIAFDQGCALDMIDDGINGFIVPLAEKKKWADALTKLCALTKDEYSEMRSQARKKAVELNGLHVFANAVEEVYKEFRPNGKK